MAGAECPFVRDVAARDRQTMGNRQLGGSVSRRMAMEISAKFAVRLTVGAGFIASRAQRRVTCLNAAPSG